ncbi:unnamed protein product [Spirodela intermedia]|uniref:Uncharacterized protein n=1 Tax=Spirodela intermedia TaxID=51605 RepID=A0A7I8IRX7_SPIIN|nr:unnamed protein product [Spirodela intermedia]CAA6660505.1 unnamed protein product [Spirodela intermedia]
MELGLGGAEEKTPVTKQRMFFAGTMEKVKGNAIGSVKMVKKIGEDDPRRILHSLKVGLALTVVSLFYYVNPLYESFGVNAMWAILTVVVVMEYTVGATLSKGLNRAFGTLVAGALGLGAHYLADLSGPKGEPIILGLLVFILAAAATFSRFIPEIKARFDYGAMIFILTFSLVAISSYRVDELIALAHQRLATIAIGGVTCMFISIFLFPVWAGEDLHKLAANNLDKLAAIWKAGPGNGPGVVTKPFLQAHKAVLNSKANLARWEPGHSRFGFRHPWKQYLKVGAHARQCAYYIEALNAHFARLGERHMCSVSAKLLKEMAACVRKKTQPSAPAHGHAVAVGAAVDDMKNAVRESGDALDVILVAPVVSLLSEIVTCTMNVAKSVEELARLAEFRRIDEVHHHRSTVQPITEPEDARHVINVGE